MASRLPFSIVERGVTRLSFPVAVTGLALLAIPARAEVTVNPQALEPAGSAVPAPHHPTHPAAHTAPGHQASPRPPAHPANTASTHPAPARPAPPVVPPAPPPVAVLAPLIPPPPAHPVSPPPPAPVVDNATGAAIPIEGGLRITFGNGSADLNPQTNDALRRLGRESPNGIFNVSAYAAGLPDDPSTPRRLSLSRALAARSLLIAEGIPSPRIYVRALGAGAGDAPPDRVDVTVTIPTSPTAANPGPPPGNK